MRMQAYVIIIAAAIITVVGLGFFINHATPQRIKRDLDKINQDPAYYLSTTQTTQTFSVDQQQKLKQVFLDLYFSPWDNAEYSAQSNAKVLAMAQQDMHDFPQKTHWQFTHHPFENTRIYQLIDNADLTGFPQIDRPGIVTHITQARLLPTLLPAYTDFTAKNGPPFDQWMGSYVYPGTPVRILQQSKDKIWYFIKTASFYSWVESEDIGFVSQDFMIEWKQHAFVTSLTDAMPLKNSKGRTLAHLHKGILYPTVGMQGTQIKILTPSLSIDGNAEIQILLADSVALQPFPLPASTRNIAKVAATFMDGQYAWGGLYELRDCSSTVADILANFGLWLPRNSLKQSQMGERISLAKMDRKEKLTIFREKAIPFFTLVHFPGHIALFLGMHNGQPYVLQNIWGKNKGIIGKTVILPLEFNKQFGQSSQLDAADALSVLTPEFYFDEANIRHIMWD